MTPEAMIAFAIAMGFFTATPGPGILAVISQAVSKGPFSAFLLLSGLLAGDLVYIIAVSFGVGVVAEQMGDLFYAVRLLGAGYLIYLGWRTWHTAIDGHDKLNHPGAKSKTLGAGLLISLGNPKVMIFYIAFLPTFVDMATISTTDIAFICAAAITSTYLIGGAYIVAAGKVSHRLKQGSTRQKFNRISGGLLMSAGLAVGLKS
ncbi:MAG: LysE family translocator [Kordiimonadaceae bacterium]|nr:LysE family translocator [Kordiimonadaceae bacterium]